MTDSNRRAFLLSATLAGAGLATRTLRAQQSAGASAAEAPANSDHEEPSPLKTSDGPTITTFLMFQGQAEEAITFYLGLFPDSRADIKRYGPGERGAEGSVERAVFSLNGQRLMAIDSPVKHDFTFTPAVSLFVTCADEANVTRYFEALAEGGQVLMPLDAYPFSKRFGWVQDRFGVSWQLSVA